MIRRLPYCRGLQILLALFLFYCCFLLTQRLFVLRHGKISCDCQHDFFSAETLRNINGHHPFVLVCAPSNASVDEIDLRVIKKLDTLDEEERFKVRSCIFISSRAILIDYLIWCLFFLS